MENDHFAWVRLTANRPAPHALSGLPSAVARILRGNSTHATWIDVGRPLSHSCGYESPQQLDEDRDLKGRLESIRLQAGPAMNLGEVQQRNVPKMCLISPAAAGGTLTTRTFIPHRCHTSIGVFGAVSVATACTIGGTVASEIAEVSGGDSVNDHAPLAVVQRTLVVIDRDPPFL